MVTGARCAGLRGVVAAARAHLHVLGNGFDSDLVELAVGRAARGDVGQRVLVAQLVSNGGKGQ